MLNWSSVFRQGPVMERMLEQLRLAPARTVGTKQTLRAVERGQVSAVFVARDADPHVVRNLLSLCRQRGLPVHEVESMEALGRSCGVEVGAASAAIVSAASPPKRPAGS